MEKVENLDENKMYNYDFKEKQEESIFNRHLNTKHLLRKKKINPKEC